MAPGLSGGWQSVRAAASRPRLLQYPERILIEHLTGSGYGVCPYGEFLRLLLHNQREDMSFPSPEDEREQTGSRLAEVMRTQRDDRVISPGEKEYCVGTPPPSSIRVEIEEPRLEFISLDKRDTTPLEMCDMNVELGAQMHKEGERRVGMCMRVTRPGLCGEGPSPGA